MSNYFDAIREALSAAGNIAERISPVAQAIQEKPQQQNQIREVLATANNPNPTSNSLTEAIQNPSIQSPVIQSQPEKYTLYKFNDGPNYLNKKMGNTAAAKDSETIDIPDNIDDFIFNRYDGIIKNNRERAKNSMPPSLDAIDLARDYNQDVTELMEKYGRKNMNNVAYRYGKKYGLDLYTGNNITKSELEAIKRDPKTNREVSEVIAKIYGHTYNRGNPQWASKGYQSGRLNDDSVARERINRYLDNYQYIKYSY